MVVLVERLRELRDYVIMLFSELALGDDDHRADRLFKRRPICSVSQCITSRHRPRKPSQRGIGNAAWHSMPSRKSGARENGPCESTAPLTLLPGICDTVRAKTVRKRVAEVLALLQPTHDHDGYHTMISEFLRHDTFVDIRASEYLSKGIGAQNPSFSRSQMKSSLKR
jgi:hypothetical protein